ncbi:topoisomerase I [Agrocybe pediades]|nr:topoisomerase I [Agrocybe pediades]
MSADSPMFSDNEGPSSTVTTNGNGASSHLNGNNGSKSEDYAMSDDDLPLSQTTRNGATSLPPRNLKRKKPAYAESSSDDDVPLASSPAKKANGKKVKQESENGDYSEEDAPPKRRTSNGRPAKKKVKEESDASNDDDEEDEQPLKSTKHVTGRKRQTKAESDEDEEVPATKKASRTPAKPRKKVKEEEASGTETPKPKRARKSKKEDADGKPAKKGRKKEEKEEEQEEIFRWWENGPDPNGDGSVKWTTLEHNGVLFPPPYEPLPSDIKMKYDGKPVDLPPEAEEVAGFYAALLDTDHGRDPTFCKNFFDDWKKVMVQHPPRDGTRITRFELCDFRPMLEYFEAEKAKKKAMSAEEKKAAKKAREEMEHKYTFCMLDGRKEKVGNFRVEPPGLFRGRGDHPKKGALKYRVRPEDITLNIGKGAPLPVPNMPGQWKAVNHDNTVTWLANWTENINGNHKYVFLAAGSSLKGQSDMQKFEKARELKNHVDRIRQNYNVDLRSKVMADRQRATAMYFIDKLALRAGNEKGEDEADTVGCCSLRCEHVTLEAPDFIIFDFLGKDSIRYYNRVPVDPQVFKNIRIFKDNKNDDDNLFDRVTTASLNKHLTNEMKGLTAKVFRTFNASITFQRLLDQENLANASLQEKLNAYNKANREVAILCNHQRSAPKTHDQSMEKMRYKHRALKYERMKLRHALFKMEPKYKKKAQYKEDESDLDEEWIAEHENDLKAKEIEKVEKRFARENEKLEEDGKKPQKDSVLKARLAEVEEEFKRLAKERGTGKADLKRERTEEKLVDAIDKLTDKIKAFKLQIVDRDAGKEVALGTSKINYLDPRITAAWCQIHDVPIEKIFSKTLITKFPWAMEVDPEWKF